MMDRSRDPEESMFEDHAKVPTRERWPVIVRINLHLCASQIWTSPVFVPTAKNVNEIVSTHGYSQNQIVVWRYPTMSKLATLTGHTLRVLYLAVSPDGQTIVTGAGDETLRFWNVFPGQRSQGGVQENSVWNLNRTQIR